MSKSKLKDIVWTKSGLGVDPIGNVYSPTGHYREQYSDSPYPRVSWNGRLYKVHRLMAEAFLGNLHLTVNHKDGDKTNNNLDNLEMLTLQDNLEHAFEARLHANPRRAVRAICKDTGEEIFFESVWNATRTVNTSNANIHRALREPHRICAGYYWRYDD